MFDPVFGSYYLQPGVTVTVAGSATSTIGALAITAGGPVNFNVAAGSTLNVTGYFSSLFGNFGLIKMGPGTMILNGANTYTGNTAVDGGTLLLANSGALSESTLDTSGAGAQFRYTQQRGVRRIAGIRKLVAEQHNRGGRSVAALAAITPTRRSPAGSAAAAA